MKNWKTAVSAVIVPLVAYGLNHFGMWPASVPLPPLDTVWPAISSAILVGWFAKDSDVTGGTREQ